MISLLNNADPTLVLDITISDHSVHFLDIFMAKGLRWNLYNYALDTSVYSKPDNINYHLLLPFHSSLPLSTRTGFIASEARRATCISSSFEAALSFTTSFAVYLRARGHPLDIIVRQLAKIDYSKRHEYLDLAVVTNAPLHCFSHQPKRYKPTDQRIVNLVLPYRPELARLRLAKTLSDLLSPFGIKPRQSWMLGGKRLGNLLGMQYP